MATTTTNLGLTLPTPNVDTGWGSTLNADFQIIDNLFNTAGTGTSVGINVGSGKTLTLGGTMILGSGTGTASPAAATIRGPTKTGTDVAGVDITIDAGNGTGTGGSGDIIFRTAPPGSAGTIANTFGPALTIRNSGDQYVIDVGDGGSGATNNISSIRINGSSSGSGVEGGSALYIANNSTETGAFGNRSTLLAGSTAYSNLTTIWGASSLSFVVGARSGATLAASQEKLRLGSSGQLYVWDTTLGTPALNAGTAGQVLTSNGSSAGLTWETPSINRSSATAFGTTGCEFTAIPSTAKMIILSFYGLTAGEYIYVQLGTGSTTYKTTGYISTAMYSTGSSAVTNDQTTGFAIWAKSQGMQGTVRLTNTQSNVWVCDYTITSAGGTNGYVYTGGGYVALSAALTAVRFNGTGVSGSGRAAILYY